MFDFITDLDGYFCEKYANYDKLCVLPGYKMPLMQASKVDEFGRTRTYTLPADTMRLATQEKKDELLKVLKTRLTDLTFSFSFVPLGFFGRIKNNRSKYGFAKHFRNILAKYGLDEKSVGEPLDVSEEIWHKIWKGKFLPTKNLLFSVALTSQISMDDLKALFTLLYEEFDYTCPKDVVISYLLTRKVYNPAMIQRAFDEYGVKNLFIK